LPLKVKCDAGRYIYCLLAKIVVCKSSPKKKV
jgi:hypothetical protein